MTVSIILYILGAYVMWMLLGYMNSMEFIHNKRRVAEGRWFRLGMYVFWPIVVIMWLVGDAWSMWRTGKHYGM